MREEALAVTPTTRECRVLTAAALGGRVAWCKSCLVSTRRGAADAADPAASTTARLWQRAVGPPAVAAGSLRVDTPAAVGAAPGGHEGLRVRAGRTDRPGARKGERADDIPAEP